MRRFLLTLAAAWAIATSAAAIDRPITLLHFTSQPGDFVGAGKTWNYAAQGASFTAYLYPADNGTSANAVAIKVHGADADWSTTFQAPGRARLTPGRYENAHRWPFQSSTQPGFSVDGDARGCNTLRGWFVVHEVVYGPSGNITSFAADFEQHCDFNTPMLYGGVRFNSTVPYVDFAPTPPPAWSLQLYGQQGNSVGGTTTLSVTEADGPMVARKDDSTEGLIFRYSSALAAFNSAFAAANNAALAPGTYELAQRWPFQQAGHPGLDVSLDGQGCNTSTGRFVIYESVVDEDRMVARFAGDFELHCEGGEAALYGSIRFESTVPPMLDPRPPTATRLALVNGQDHYRVPAHGSLTGMQVMTVDDAGTPIGNQRVSVGSGCGPFEGQVFSPLELRSDSSGLVTIPKLFLGTNRLECAVNVQLTFTSVSVDLIVDVTGVAAALAYVDASHAFVARTGVPFAGLRFAVVDSVGDPVPGEAVRAYGGGCGTFGSDSHFFGASDGAGIVTLPAWTPTTTGPCTVTGFLDADLDKSITFSMTVTADGQPPPLPTATFLHANSQRGDRVGQGATTQYTSTDGPFSVSFPTSAPHSIQVLFHKNDSSDAWSLVFSPPTGQTLGPGRYEARPFATATGAAIGISGHFNSCNDTRGYFVIRELVVGANNAIVSFAADFEQHCELMPPAVYGGIRFNSSVPYVDFDPTPFPQGTVQVFSDPGDSIGQAYVGAFNNLNGEMSGGAMLNNDGVAFQYVSNDGPPITVIQARFRGPDGVQVAPGTYELAHSFSNPGSGHPGISVSWFGGCSDDTGRFVIHEIGFDVDGLLTNLAADFEDHCNGSTAGVYGAIRYNSSIPAISDPRRPFATHLDFVDAQHTFMVGAGGMVSGLRVATVDDAGNRIANQGVRLDNTCDSYTGLTAFQRETTSDGDGIVTIPSWQTPIGGYRCQVPVSLDWNNDQISFDVYVTGVTAWIEIVGSSNTFSTDSSVVVNGLSVRTLDSTGAPLGNQPLQATATCGSFGGASVVSLQSDSSGIATLPTWTAPSQPAICQLSASSLTAPFPSVSFVVDVASLAIAPGTPPVGLTTLSGPSPSGGTLRLSASSAAQSCTLSGVFTNPPITVSAGFANPFGLIEFQADNCGVGATTTFTLQLPQAVPAGSQWWQYGGTPNNPSPHWYSMDTTGSGTKLSFKITDGARGDNDLTLNGTLAVRGTVIVPAPTPDGIAAAASGVQDLWWAGSAENGWGLSIIQHGDKLFANVFAYDAQGNPTWYVMPGGAWNDSHTAFTAAVYSPKGSPFYAYDASLFDIGEARGTMTLTFADANTATFEYSIDGIAGKKNLTRTPFGPVAPPSDRSVGDLWWAGPAQNGWGLSILQQYETLFALWFTYDANGKATWFVMPDVEFVARDVFRGPIYRPEGSAWLGVPYDASRHKTVKVGTFNLDFTDTGATFGYSIDQNAASVPLSRIPF